MEYLNPSCTSDIYYECQFHYVWMFKQSCFNIWFCSFSVFSAPALLLDWTSESPKHFASYSVVFISGHQHCYCVHSSCLTCCVLSCCAWKPFSLLWSLGSGSLGLWRAGVVPSSHKLSILISRVSPIKRTSIKKQGSVFFPMYTVFSLANPNIGKHDVN